MHADAFVVGLNIVRGAVVQSTAHGRSCPSRLITTNSVLWCSTA